MFQNQNMKTFIYEFKYPRDFHKDGCYPYQINRGRATIKHEIQVQKHIVLTKTNAVAW